MRWIKQLLVAALIATTGFALISEPLASADLTVKGVPVKKSLKLLKQIGKEVRAKTHHKKHKQNKKHKKHKKQVLAPVPTPMPTPAPTVTVN